MTTVHPRVCGEAKQVAENYFPGLGPSPRVRGSHFLQRLPPHERGAIPACAGKPRRQPTAPATARVHPRVCGEARAMGCDRSCWDGSIPACAGKPWTRSATGRPEPVHPRVCGEARNQVPEADPVTGPSPRVRGSRLEVRAVQPFIGSIPACAGKPVPCGSSSCAWRVHPRVCGEADARGVGVDGRRGPSPRVRGSRRVSASMRNCNGSIPACAGKPHLRRSS